MSKAIRMLVNGQVAEPTSNRLRDLLSTLDIELTTKGVAIAKNGELILRQDWEKTILVDGDDIEVVHATQGG